MAGHSKWAQIKRQKAVADQKRSESFAKFSKLIANAVRLGGSDPSSNFRLRDLMDKAKAKGMPRDNIERARKRHAGGEGVCQINEVIYEGYGPAGVALLMEAATDNKNRTASELRLILSEAGGNLGENGCVSWMFKSVALLYVPHNQEDGTKLDVEQLFSGIAELPIEDCSDDRDPDNFLVESAVENFETVRRAIREEGYECYGELTRLPINMVELEDPAKRGILDDMLEEIESCEDVTGVFHNVKPV